MAFRAEITDKNIHEAAQEVKFIQNRFTRSRGQPTLLRLTCALCNSFVALYQKDGKGRLLRLYRDRIHFPKELAEEDQLVCSVCSSVLGTSMIYKQEDRPAFRLKPGSIEQTKERI